MASAKRDILVDTALRLFSENGYRATGIDKILKESGVAKMTLYKHFKSKDELIIAALKKRDENLLAEISTYMQQFIPQQNCDPRIINLMAFFDALHANISDKSFYGCNFINASVEFKNENNPIHALATTYKNKMILMLQELLVDLQLPDAHYVASSIHMLIEGGIIMAITLGDKNVALQVKDNALKILDSYAISPPLKNKGS